MEWDGFGDVPLKYLLRFPLQLRQHLWIAHVHPTPFDPQAGEWMLPALASLDPEHRAVIVLRYLLEYTPGEIADLLDLPRGTVNSRLRRGLDRLKEGLE